ncbi:ring-cleaving dioxygenase [Micavibrio aeruginosavorus]|uniref:Glyoxalase family protein n=1 Tax=Micavibrio aeruginosavorus EPB TaxID=349215 RepID=M4VHL0_9BACT|nr:ring-cleaving dioxygenase [Micavibrio aeruginosavorus]AGH98698.1 Glyoxalase family protein [Micavibrio aeruginosavorus EPB]
MKTASGIHHITAIASDPKVNFDFYTKVLGLRFVKRTVNFDDPSTYHFYFGDSIGSPGSILTFFPHPDLAKGRHGTGQAVEIVFAVPKAALSFWMNRFHEMGITYQGPEKHFDETVVRIQDPDGLMLEFVGVDDLPDDTAWATDDIPTDAAIRGFHSVSLWVDDYTKTADILTRHLGFKYVGNDGSRYRYIAEGDGVGKIVDIRSIPGMWRGAPGAGTIHHVAFRVGDDEAETKVRDAIIKDGHSLTPVIDRNYFHSVYFREPNHVLFELATDNPGFDVDEPREQLGQELKLPQKFENYRDDIVAVLPVL